MSGLFTIFATIKNVGPVAFKLLIGGIEMITSVIKMLKLVLSFFSSMGKPETSSAEEGVDGDLKLNDQNKNDDNDNTTGDTTTTAAANKTRKRTPLTNTGTGIIHSDKIKQEKLKFKVCQRLEYMLINLAIFMASTFALYIFLIFLINFSTGASESERIYNNAVLTNNACQKKDLQEELFVACKESREIIETRRSWVRAGWHYAYSHTYLCGHVSCLDFLMDLSPRAFWITTYIALWSIAITVAIQCWICISKKI